jgi:hypothetical protein
LEREYIGIWNYLKRLIIARNGKIKKNLADGDKAMENNRRKWNQDSDL